MDPTAFIRLGQIRQQEILEQAERYRQEQPIWERLWAWSAALWQRRAKPKLPTSGRRVAAAPDMIEYC